MAEFLVGAPMLILLWAGVDYFRMGFARRLETMSRSHAEAWEKAYSNDGTCFAGAKPWDGFTKSATSDMPSGATDKSDSSIFKYNVARSSKDMALTSSRWSGHVVSSTSVTCNEVVPTDDRNVLKPMIDFIKSVL